MAIGELIRQTFVPAIDRLAPLGGQLSESGGLIQLGRLPQSDIEFYKEKLGDLRRYRLSRREIQELMFKLSGFNLNKLLDDYFGALWWVDYGLIWRAPPQSTSGQWHHDNVGNRVKLFFILANDSTDNGTEVISHSNKVHHKVFTGRYEIPNSRPIFVQQTPGDVVLFDTNAIHRGLYSTSERMIVQLEFSNVLKSFLVPGQVGRFFRGRYENAG
jgi:hypothetical protein